MYLQQLFSKVKRLLFWAKRHAHEGPRWTSRKITQQTAVTWNALMATDAARQIEKFFESVTESAPTVYDKAVDVIYNATHIGGGNHRLFDESHTLTAMWDKVKDAVPDDSFTTEMQAYLATMWKDLATPAGLPLKNMTREQYDKAATFLSDHLNLSRDWFSDVLTTNLSELIGSAIGGLAIVFAWNKAETKDFDRLVGSLFISAAVGANPLLIVLTLIGLARAFNVARETGNYQNFIVQTGRGAVGMATFIAATGVVGGPIGLVVGVLASLAVNKVIDHVLEMPIPSPAPGRA
ncbi:hypothetical protein ES705_10688 [subsurface metagenome]